MQLFGIMTALVTPMHRDGCVDLDALTKLIESQIRQGVDGLVVLGTTGESATLTQDERNTLAEHALKVIDGRVTSILGAGSNSTREAEAMHQWAHALGYDAALHVTPWYNKPTQEGLYLHYERIANACELPILLYNVPSRTGVDLEPSTVLRIAKNIPQAIGIKEASGSIQRAQDLIHRFQNVRPDFSILSGDDGFILGLLSIGGHGVVSVISHLCLPEMRRMFDAYADKRLSDAQELSARIWPLVELCFFRSNPIPVKAALAEYTRMSPSLRAPLSELNKEDYDFLRQILHKQPIDLVRENTEATNRGEP